MKRRLPKVLLLLVLGAVMQSRCGDGSGGECRYDTDCPGTQVCEDGRCVSPTRCPEVPCPEGETCVRESCYPEDCERRQCPGIGEICIDEQCAPAGCVGVDCPEGQICAADGRCYPEDCETHFCPGYGEVCVDDECVQRTCVGVECPEGQECAGGFCYPAVCGGVFCAPDEVCVDDECVHRSCANVSCGPGERCVDGLCIGSGLPELTVITAGGGRLDLANHRVELFISPATLLGNTSSTNYRVRLGPGAIRNLRK
jgi:hypothetical protein